MKLAPAGVIADSHVPLSVRVNDRATSRRSTSLDVRAGENSSIGLFVTFLKRGHKFILPHNSLAALLGVKAIATGDMIVFLSAEVRLPQSTSHHLSPHN